MSRQAWGGKGSVLGGSAKLKQPRVNQRVVTATADLYISISVHGSRTINSPTPPGGKGLMTRIDEIRGKEKRKVTMILFGFRNRQKE